MRSIFDPISPGPASMRLFLLLAVSTLASWACAEPSTQQLSDTHRTRAAASEHHVLVNQNISPPVWQEARRLGAERAYIIYQWTTDQKRTGCLDLVKMREYIAKTIPPSFDGFACLDFEHPYFPNLLKGTSAPEFHESQQQLLLALRAAKAIRPNASWSIWGLPRVLYRRYNADDIALVKAPAALLAEMDWMAPSIYDTHRNNDSPRRPQQERAFVAKVVGISHEIAGGRPVLPYVYHRYSRPWAMMESPSLELVPDEEFREFIRWALEDGADGVVWWGADDYERKLLAKPPRAGHPSYDRYRRATEIYRTEKPPGMTLERHHDQLHMRVLRMMSEEVFGRPNSPTTAPQ